MIQKTAVFIKSCFYRTMRTQIETQFRVRQGFYNLNFTYIAFGYPPNISPNYYKNADIFTPWAAYL